MVTWMNMDALKLPAMGKYRGTPHTEALYAISRFTGCFAVDLTDTIKWPFFTKRIHDYDIEINKQHPFDVIDTVAKNICKEHDKIAVLCAGDVDSVAVLAAICKHVDDLSNVIVKYTKAGVDRYPKLFNEILPSLGVTMDCRDGMPLVGSDTTYYVDGRSGDDWQAGYQATTLKRLRDQVDINDLDAVIHYIASKHDTRSRFIRAATKGIRQFIDGCPFEIKTGWDLILAIYKCFASQHDIMVGHITEDDVKHSYNHRIPFYDHKLFCNATAYLMDEEVPDEDTDGYYLRKYAFDYFGDQEWFDVSRPSSVFYVYRLGYINTHYIDGDMHVKGYDKLEDDI